MQNLWEFPSRSRPLKVKLYLSGFSGGADTEVDTILTITKGENVQDAKMQSFPRPSHFHHYFLSIHNSKNAVLVSLWSYKVPNS